MISLKRQYLHLNIGWPHLHEPYSFIKDLGSPTCDKKLVVYFFPKNSVNIRKVKVLGPASDFPKVFLNKPLPFSGPQFSHL